MVSVNAVGVAILHCANTCATHFQAELLGVCAFGEHFSVWLSLSHVLKRASYAIFAFMAVTMFQAGNPGAVYTYAGSILSAFGVCVFLVFFWLKVLPHQRWRTT